MAKYTNEIHYNVTTDFKDNGLNKLNQEIIKIQDRLQNLKLDVKDTGSIDKITAKLDLFRDAINQSYNFRLNTTDLTKMNQLLAQSKVDVRELARDFASLGDQGRLAFMQINNELSKFNMQAKNVSAVTQKIWNTVGNTVRWGIISNGFQSVLDSVNRATGYVKELDRSLTDIRLVSNYSAQEMQRFAEQANKAAKALGSTTVAYTDASAIFVQQGMSLDNAEKMADLTIKVSNITGQTTSEVSEQITAWMNGYQLQAEELQRTLDSVVKVAAVSAADTEEIMTAASKVASTASTVGVSTDQLVAQMATIISTTREAPEAVGNAMKTIYSRLSSLKLGETLEDNVTLNSMTATLEKIGVQVLDDNNDLRDMGTIIEELQQKWVDLSDAQRMAASVQLAGRYQLNRFLALMNNQDYYKQMMSAAEGSGGFLDEKQAVYLESLEGHLNTLKASIEGIATAGLDTDDFNDFLEVLTDITDGIGTAVDAVGGFGPLIQSIGPILLKAFSSNIADSVTRFAGNIEQATIKVNNLKHANDLLKITNEEIFTTFDNTGGSASKLVNSLQQLSETRINASTNLSAEAQQRLNEAFEQGTSVLKQYIEVRQQQNLLEQKQANLDNVLINTNKSSTKLDVNTKEIRQRGYIDQSGRVTADGVKFLNDNLDITVQKGEKFGAVIKKIKKALVELDSQLKQTGKAGEEAGSGLEVAAEAARDLDKSVKLQNFISSLTKMIGTIGQAAMSVQMFQSAWNKFNDETIEDPIERFNQVVIDLSFGIGMVLPIFSNLIEHYIQYKKAAVEAAKAAALLREAEQAETSIRVQNTLAGIVEETVELKNATDNATKARKAFTVAEKEAKALSLAGYIANIKDVLVGLKDTIFGILGVLPPPVKIIGAIVGIGAAIGGLVTAYENLWSPAARTKQYQEELDKKIQEMSAHYSKTKEESQALYDSIDKYKDLKDSLSEFPENTEAWRKKLEEVKGEVENLIKIYPKLAEVVDYTGSGIPIFTEEDLNAARRGQAKDNLQSALGSTSVQADSAFLENDENERNLQLMGIDKTNVNAIAEAIQTTSGDYSKYDYIIAEQMYNNTAMNTEGVISNAIDAIYQQATQGIDVSNDEWKTPWLTLIDYAATNPALKNLKVDFNGSELTLSDILSPISTQIYDEAVKEVVEEGIDDITPLENVVFSPNLLNSNLNNPFMATIQTVDSIVQEARTQEPAAQEVLDEESQTNNSIVSPIDENTFNVLFGENGLFTSTFPSSYKYSGSSSAVYTEQATNLDYIDEQKAILERQENVLRESLSGQNFSEEQIEQILSATHGIFGDQSNLVGTELGEAFYNYLTQSDIPADILNFVNTVATPSMRLYGDETYTQYLENSEQRARANRVDEYNTILQGITGKDYNNIYNLRSDFLSKLPDEITEFDSIDNFMDLIENVGGLSVYLENIDYIISQLSKGISVEDIKDQLDISEWQHSLDDNQTALEGYLGKDQQLIDNITESFVEATGQADKFSDEQKSTYALLTVASQNAAKHLLETYKDAIEQFNSEDIIIHETGFRSLQLDLSNLLGIPFEKITEDYVQQLIDEDLLEGMFTGDSKAIQTGQELWFAGIEGVDQAIAERVVSARNQIAESPDEFSDILNRILNDKTLNITPEIEQAILAMFNSMRLEDGTIVQFDIGVGEATVALSDFAKALTDTDSEIGKAIAQKLGSNVDISEETAKNIEDAYRSTLTNSDYIYGFNDNQAAQILSASIANPELLEKQYLDQIKALYGEGSNGYTLEEAIQKVIQDIQDNNWFSNRAGWTKKAQELGLTLEEFETKVNKYKEDHGLENLDEAAQKLAEELQEEAEARKQDRTNAITKIQSLNSAISEEQIGTFLDKYGSEFYQAIVDSFTKNPDRSWDQFTKDFEKEQNSNIPWYNPERRDQYLKEEKGYSTEQQDRFNVLYNEFLSKYSENNENRFRLAAEQARAQLDYEIEIAEQTEERLAQEQRQINAQQAIKELYKEYSEEGFSLDNPAALQNIRKQLASIFDMTAEELETALGEGGLEKLVNSDAFKDFMSGDKSAIANLENALRKAGLNVDELDISLEDLFILAQQGIEEVKKTLQETISDILQIIKNISEGDTVSDDQYKLLVEQLGQEAVDQYFTTMADGTHMLVGAADEFKQNAMAITRGKIVGQLTKVNNQSEAGDNDYLTSYNPDEEKFYTEQLFSTAGTLEELQALRDLTLEINTVQETSFDAYNENLLRLGMNYENATDEVKAFREAQASGNEENIAAAQRDLEGSIAIGEDQSLKELDLDPTEIDDYADHLQDLAAMEEDVYLGGEKLADSLEEDEGAAAMLSKQLTRMNRAVGTLEKNWDDWADILQNSSKGSEEYFDAMQSTRSAMSDLLDISEDFISADLVDSLANNAENMELMQRAAEGDGEAIDQLRQLALEDIVVNITEQNHLDPDFLSSQIADIQAMLPDIEVGATVSAVDDSELINALNSMIVEAAMTKDQVNALLGSMGFSGNFASETQTVPNKIAITTTQHHRDYRGFDDKGNPTDWTDVETASTEYIDADGAYTSFAFVTAPQGETAVPQLNSITRKASGSANNYSPSNLGGNSSGGKGSGGGGGGKGGGGSSKKNKADPIEKEKDRYQKVNEQIAKTVAEYDQLTEAQDRLLGPELAMNLEEQNEKLEEQIDLQKEKLRIQREEQRDRQKDLSQYGIQFNPDGTISNYSEVWDAQNAKLEAARQAYNGTDTEDEAAKEAWEAAQAYFDDFAEGITKYDSLLESIYDTNSELQNLRNAIDDLSKSIVETAYDSLNSLQDLDDTMAEVRLNLSDPFGDDIWKQLESATDRLSDWFQMDEESANTAYNSLINQAQKLIDKTTDKAEKESLQRYIDNASNDLNSGSTGYLDMWNAQTNNLLKEYNDLMTTGSNKSGLSAGSLHELMDTAFGDGAEKLGSLVDQLQKARDLALDAMDEINDKFEDRKEQYEVINDELEHQLELSEMLHGDQAYAEQEKVLQAQINNSKGQLGIAAEQVKLYEAWSKNAIEGTEEWKKANELLTDAQKDYNEQVEKAVELTQKLYENTINSQLDKWIQNALGNDMDWVQEEWELIQRNAEQYLDDVEKAYNIQKLQNSYEDLLNQSNQLDIQQQITDQMNQQLGYLRGKTQLSKYDVDYANAQLEILQRQIALEEARRNKNQMRLSRDAQGNYSYVYTANRDDVNNAESGLLDAQFNAYNLSKQNIIDSQSNALSALNDFYSSAQAIATNYNLSEEERAARLQSLWDYNREYLQGCAEQLGTSFENIQNDFYGMVDALEDINEGNLTEWTQRLKDGTMDMTMVMSEILSDAIFDWLTKFENFELDTYAVISQMLDSWNEYTTGLTDMGASVGETIGDITEATQQCVEQTNKLTESQSGFFDLLEKQAGTVDNYLTQMQGYADTIANLEGQMSQYKDNMEKLEKILRENYISYELNGELVDNSKKPSGGNGGNGKGGSGNGSGGKGSGAGGKTSNGTKFTNEELIEGVAGNIWTYGSWANDPTRAGDLAKKFGADMAVAIQQFVNRGMEALTHDWTTGYYRQFGIDAFATGGYTGSWDGGDGKLAILDSKELVLNAKDTENMLAAVNLVREVVRSMQGTTLSSGLSSLNGAFSSAASTVDQNVTITANFPNATSESEIKSAILGLVDQSVQYSARTKPTGKVF